MAVPNSLPTAAVAAMASAPQNATHRPPTHGDAPPARAASAPRTPRQVSDTPEISNERWLSGARMTTSMGKISPKEKVAADANAAWAVVSRLISSSYSRHPRLSVVLQEVASRFHPRVL